MLRMPSLNIAELSDRACFARGAAQPTTEDCMLKTIRAPPFGSLFLMLIVEGTCSWSPKWHGDVNTVQHWRGVWEPIGRQAWEPSRTTPGMDLGNYGDDFGMNIRRGVHAYALSGSTVNLFHSYTDLLSCYVGVDTALGQKRDSSVDDRATGPTWCCLQLESVRACSVHRQVLHYFPVGTLPLHSDCLRHRRMGMRRCRIW